MEIIDKAKARIKKYEIKKNVKEHEVLYSCIVTGVAVAGITALIMRGRHAVVCNAASDGPIRVTVRSLSFFSHHNNIVTVIEREGRGHPGYMVRCLETNDFFLTQGEAARHFNVDGSVMSRHITGSLENAGGHHFERMAA